MAEKRRTREEIGGRKEKSTAPKWNWLILVEVYRMVRAEMPDTEICKVLDISRQTLWQWQRQHPELREAIAMARKEVSTEDHLPKWVYERLSPELKKVWEKILEFEEEEDGIAKIEHMLQDHGRAVRQQLFLHALCVYKFSASQALAKVNLSKVEFDRWMSCDPGFAELVTEIQWHKGNFFETALVDLVEQGNPAAVVFANKTYNSNRGYASKSEMQVNHSGSVLHGVVDLGELMQYLSESGRLELLGAIRKKEEVENRANSTRVLSYEEIIDAEIGRSDV